jgi:hypothetical protein
MSLEDEIQNKLNLISAVNSEIFLKSLNLERNLIDLNVLINQLKKSKK